MTRLILASLVLTISILPLYAQSSSDAVQRTEDLRCVELGTFGWQRDDGNVGQYDEACPYVPAGLVDQKDSVTGGFNGCGDLREMQVHRFGIASRQDQGCALKCAVPLLWIKCPERTPESQRYWTARGK